MDSSCEVGSPAHHIEFPISIFKRVRSLFIPSPSITDDSRIDLFFISPLIDVGLFSSHLPSLHAMSQNDAFLYGAPSLEHDREKANNLIMFFHYYCAKLSRFFRIAARDSVADGSSCEVN